MWNVFMPYSRLEIQYCLCGTIIIITYIQCRCSNVACCFLLQGAVMGVVHVAYVAYASHARQATICLAPVVLVSE